jgi:hypothetical protein
VGMSVKSFDSFVSGSAERFHPFGMQQAGMKSESHNLLGDDLLTR